MQNRSKANIVLFGRTGAGKSSFINYILGSNVAPTGCGEPVTITFDEYEYVLRNGISIRIFDSKGLEVDGYHEAVNEMLDFTSNRSNSKKVLEWIHSAFYCININRARLEAEEVSFIKRVSDTIGYPVHIIITHCRGAKNAENESAMQEKILSDLGEKAKVYCVNSVEKRLRTGEVVHQFGRELVIKDLIELLWENTAKKIASNYAKQMRAGLFRIIDGIRREHIKRIDSAKVSDLKKGKIPGDGFEESAEATIRYIREMNTSYNDSINSFLNMYCLLTNALGSKQIKQFSPYALSYDVLFDDSLDDELKSWYTKQVNEISSKTGVEAILDNIDYMINPRDSFKEPVIYLCRKMRERVPSQEKIEQDIYKMLLKVKEENARHSPSVRVFKKIGPNDPCPCGSGRKFKKCCMGKGIYD